jgi:hypothetical protein
VLAQSCPNGDCPNNQSITINLNGNSGGWLQWLVDFFKSLFGGGGSQPVSLPGDHRHAHYVECQLIGCDSVTPNMGDSAGAEGRITLAQMEDDEDPAESGEMESIFFEHVFNGRPTVTPYGGVILRYNGGEYFLPPALRASPAGTEKD